MNWLEKTAAWGLAVLWLLPLLYAFWAAFHPPAFATAIIASGEKPATIRKNCSTSL